MVMQILPYMNANYPTINEEDDLRILDLNLLDLDGLPDPIEQIEEETQQELAEIERKRLEIENRRLARIAEVNLIREHRVSSENGVYKKPYLPAETFIALVERQVSVINFIKDPEISGPVTSTAFTVIKVVTATVAYAYIFPALNATCTQLITDYLHQVPILSSLLNKGLSIIKLPYDLVKWAWDPTKYWAQCYEIDYDGCSGDPIFNADGTPKMYETSRREQIKSLAGCTGIALALKYGPITITALIDKIRELQETHLLNQDWARTFFSTYFVWKARKLKDIETQYSMPDVFQNDAILNQPKYRCAKSGQFLIIPFKTSSNKVFQYSVIEEWLLTHHTCPVTEPEQNLQANQLTFDEKTYNEISDRLQAITDRPIQLNP